MSDTSENKTQTLISIPDVLHGFFKYLKRFLIFVLLVTLLFGAVGGLKTVLTFTPMYRATATYSVELDDYSASYYPRQVARQLSASFPHIITSSDLTTIVKRDLGVDRLNGNISAKVLENTNILTVSVTSDNAQDAYDILISVLKSYPEVAVFVIGDTTLKQIIAPAVPSEQYNNMNLFNNIVKWTLAGLLLALAVVLLLSMLSPTVLHKDDITKTLNIKNVVAIPEIKKGGKSEKEVKLCIKDKSTNRRFYDSISKLRSSVVHACHDSNLKSIIVTSTLPAEGKTTVAVNLAISLSHHSKKVLLVECDMRNPSVLFTLGYTDCNVPFSDVVRGNQKLGDCVIRENKYLDVLPEKSFNKDASELIASDYLKRMITFMSDKYDYIILDSPPVSVAADALTLSEFSDAVLYVVRQDYSVKSKVRETAEKFNIGKAIPIVAVLNRAKKAGILSGSYGYGYGYGYGGYGKYYSKYYGRSK